MYDKTISIPVSGLLRSKTTCCGSRDDTCDQLSDECLSLFHPHFHYTLSFGQRTSRGQCTVLTSKRHLHLHCYFEIVPSHDIRSASSQRILLRYNCITEYCPSPKTKSMQSTSAINKQSTFVPSYVRAFLHNKN